MEKQHTINAALSFKGLGLHTARKVNLRLLPAPENTGIILQRTDLEGQPVLPAIADYVSQTERGTVLSNGQMSVSTLEHLMATLSALGVDNVIVQLDAPEVPIMDGSAREYVTAICAVGLKEQEAERDCYVVTKKISFKDERSGSEICILPDSDFSVDLMIDFHSKILGHQYARYSKNVNFATEVAPCRTFVFFHEILFLYKNNLIKGGSMDNAIVIVENDPDPEQLETLRTLFNTPDVKPQKGYLNNLELHFDNECARHKLLDLLGDFALIGKPVRGRVIAVKPGHALNTKVAAMVRKTMLENK